MYGLSKLESTPMDARINDTFGPRETLIAGEVKTFECPRCCSTNVTRYNAGFKDQRFTCRACKHAWGCK
jgi:hypothetical protein